MTGTWWVGQNELDDDQRSIISLPLDDNVFVTGPPGSGKTNLLLLRANYLYLAGQHNIAVVTFTRSLREFIASGAIQYEFPSTKIMTCREWQNDFLRQYGIRVKSSGTFEEDRTAFLTAMNDLTTTQRLSKIFDAILLDEAQDYSPGEIRLFAQLAERLFCVADERQKIYNGEDSISEIVRQIGDPNELRFHYRNGVNICRVADEIAKKWKGYRQLTETSNYDENANPSTVDCSRCNSVEEQIALIVSRLRTQRLAFPGQLIGVLCPKNEMMHTIYEAILKSEHSDATFLLHSSVGETFPTDKHVIVSNFHTAKGLEFRALHLAGCEDLRLFENNRRMAFTAVTRAKTALSIYHCADLHGYLDAALRSLEPAPGPPSLKAVFGGGR